MSIDTLLTEIRSCQRCQQHLPLSPRPILQASGNSKLLIAGQAPGAVTHDKHRPFDDKSGERLREWLNVDIATFYDENSFALIPMGFCYPGKGKSGDLPPRKECAETWREQLLTGVPKIQLTILLGQYAINWHLARYKQQKQLDVNFRNITELVQQYELLLAHNLIALPHPSPRNNLWLKKNPWFEQEVIPLLQQRVNQVLLN